jgi:hypothetical protein
MLATEYKLLKDEKADTTETAKQIYYTLKAINRLDMAAEPFF